MCVCAVWWWVTQRKKLVCSVRPVVTHNRNIIQFDLNTQPELIAVASLTVTIVQIRSVRQWEWEKENSFQLLSNYFGSEVIGNSFQLPNSTTNWRKWNFSFVWTVQRLLLWHIFQIQNDILRDIGANHFDLPRPAHLGHGEQQCKTIR